MPQESARKDGPSYDLVIKDLKALISNAQQKALDIQRKFVPSGYVEPRPETTTPDADSVFEKLVAILPELSNLNETLESIIECF